MRAGVPLGAAPEVDEDGRRLLFCWCRCLMVLVLVLMLVLGEVGRSGARPCFSSGGSLRASLLSSGIGTLPTLKHTKTNTTHSTSHHNINSLR